LANSKNHLFLRPIIKPKKNTMKKLFAILAISGALVACNNGGDSDKPAADSNGTKPATDSNTMMKKADTMMNKADTMMKKADTMVNKAKDAVKDAKDAMKKAN
jgi:2C-methyl-D-erythritol 2,4-cyclodiphosphate synthase